MIGVSGIGSRPAAVIKGLRVLQLFWGFNRGGGGASRPAAVGSYLTGGARRGRLAFRCLVEERLALERDGEATCGGAESTRGDGELSGGGGGGPGTVDGVGALLCRRPWG